MNIATVSTYFLDTHLGHEDIGNGNGDTTREAKEALVLKAVGIKEKWKMPVLFYLTREVTADQQKTLIMAAMNTLQEQNIHVHVYWSRLTELPPTCLQQKKIGCYYAQDVYYFEYKARQIFVTRDACHMLKVIRYDFLKFSVVNK